jgi:hypothetical protein
MNGLIIPPLSGASIAYQTFPFGISVGLLAQREAMSKLQVPAMAEPGRAQGAEEALPEVVRGTPAIHTAMSSPGTEDWLRPAKQVPQKWGSPCSTSGAQEQHSEEPDTKEGLDLETVEEAFKVWQLHTCKAAARKLKLQLDLELEIECNEQNQSDVDPKAAEEETNKASDNSDDEDQESQDVVLDSDTVGADIYRMKQAFSNFSFTKEDTEFKPPKTKKKGGEISPGPLNIPEILTNMIDST